jgi:hypothetical protein
MAADGRGGRNTSQRHSSRTSPAPFHPESNINGNGTSTNNHHPQAPGPYSTSFSADALAAMSSAQWNQPYGDNNHPLVGVSSDTYDLEANNNAWSLMPPPGFNDDSPTNYPNLHAHHHPQQQQHQHSQHHHSLSDGSILSPNTTVSAGGYANAFDDEHTNGNNNFPLSADDWLALPMDPLLNLSGADVTQTQFGLSLNGFDALDVLLSGNGGFQ